MSENKPISVMHVSSPLTWRGGEQQLFYLYNGLNSMGIAQFVFCPVGSVLAKKINPDQCLTYIKRSGFDLLAAWKLNKACRLNHINLIHCHDAHAHTTAVLSADLFGNKTPFVLSRRVDFPIKNAWFTKHKYNHKNIKSIVCVSNAIKEILSPTIHNKAIRLTTVHSGVDTQKTLLCVPGKLRNELNISEDQILIGNVAALADHKDYPTFLQTIKRLQEQARFSFVVIGNGPMEAEIKGETARLGLSNQIIYTGFRSDLSEIFCDLDILLFPSKTEGLGTTVLDAFANGVMVVATNAGGIPEMVVDEETGLLCKVGDAEGLSNAIKRLVEDEALQKKLKANALKMVDQFSSEAMVAKTVDEYKRIME